MVHVHCAILHCAILQVFNCAIVQVCKCAITHCAIVRLCKQVHRCLILPLSCLPNLIFSAHLNLFNPPEYRTHSSQIAHTTREFCGNFETHLNNVNTSKNRTNVLTNISWSPIFESIASAGSSCSNADVISNDRPWTFWNLRYILMNDFDQGNY